MVFVHFADGFEEIEALTAVDILRRADIDVKTVSIMPGLTVTGTHGVQVVCDILFENADYDACEMIVLPGGLPGATNLDEHKGLREKILAFASGEKRLAAICAAPLVLGHAGVLKGREATCYPGVDGELTGAKIATSNVCVDGNIITSRGPATAMDFALELVRALKGDEERDRIAEDMLYTK